MKTSVNDIVRDLRTYATVAQDLLEDITMASKTRVLYNIDFNMLYEFIWGKSTAQVPRFKPYSSILRRILALKDLKTDFELVFTGPSFWELLDSIYHKVKEVESYEYGALSYHPELKTAFDSLGDDIGKADFSDFEQVLMNSS